MTLAFVFLVVGIFVGFLATVAVFAVMVGHAKREGQHPEQLRRLVHLAHVNWVLWHALGRNVPPEVRQ